MKKYAAIVKLANDQGGIAYFDTFAELDKLVPDEDWPMFLVCHVEDVPMFMAMLQVHGVEDW